MSAKNSFSKEVEQSLRYLASDAAEASLRADSYWPKWDSPWWHMLLLYEMGLAREIPERAIETFISALDGMPIKFFPIQANEVESGFDPFRDILCHCAVGSAYKILDANGVAVDEELPWLRQWFTRYQMSDGGMSCDNEAYLAENEVPSSMVGTLPIFEALVKHVEEWTPNEEAFVELAAQFLMNRQLVLGSSTQQNSSERESAKEWPKLCFPRFYFYDSLRGLKALADWSARTGSQVPQECIAVAADEIAKQYPDGIIRVARQAHAGKGTLMQNEKGVWLRKQPNTSFALLDRVSVIGEESDVLTQEWRTVRSTLKV